MDLDQENDSFTNHSLRRSVSERRLSAGAAAAMTPDEERERRASIQEIMQDPELTPLERRQSIQSLMDGRRRSSNALTTGEAAASSGMSMMAAAAAAAAEFYDSSEDEDNDDDDEGMRMQVDDDDDDDDDHDDYNNDSQNNRYNNRDPTTTTSSSSDDVLPQRQDTSASSSSSDSSSTALRYNRRRVGRSASLKDFAAGAAAAAAACAAATMEVSDDPDDVLNVCRRMEKSRPPCNHYERNCTIISPCCGLAFGCRICHDECPVLPPPTNACRICDEDDECRPVLPPSTNGNRANEWKDVMDASKVPSETIVQTNKRRRSLPVTITSPIDQTHHTIDRFAVKEIICRKCFTRQDSKTNTCISCGIQFGRYHCAQCNLWMSDAEDPYHCEHCGFCRVGGRANFRHCHDCGMCIDAQLFANHNCKAGRYMSNCPVCQEDLFSSRSASHDMPCGHAIHWHCFKELMTYDTKCPVCKKTAETREHMAPVWTATAMSIALQPVPPEMARVVNVVCIDCEARDENRQWHFLGVQCRQCSSFNTNVEKIVLIGRQAAGAGVSISAPVESATTTDGGGIGDDVDSRSGVAAAMEQHHQQQQPVTVDDDVRPDNAMEE